VNAENFKFVFDLFVFFYDAELYHLSKEPFCSSTNIMDYRAWGSWKGNVRGQLGKVSYGGSDVACILLCISSIMRVCGPTAICQALAT